MKYQKYARKGRKLKKHMKAKGRIQRQRNECELPLLIGLEQVNERTPTREHAHTIEETTGEYTGEPSRGRRRGRKHRVTFGRRWGGTREAPGRL